MTTTTRKKNLSMLNQVHVPDGKNDEKQYVYVHLPFANQQSLSFRLLNVIFQASMPPI